MPASTKVITDITTVITNGPNAATAANVATASGIIMDYPGNMNLLLLKMQETAVLLAMVIGETDSTDAANLTLLNNLAITFT